MSPGRHQDIGDPYQRHRERRDRQGGKREVVPASQDLDAVDTRPRHDVRQDVQEGSKDEQQGSEGKEMPPPLDEDERHERRPAEHAKHQRAHRHIESARDRRERIAAGTGDPVHDGVVEVVPERAAPEQELGRGEQQTDDRHYEQPQRSPILPTACEWLPRQRCGLT